MGDGIFLYFTLFPFSLYSILLALFHRVTRRAITAAFDLPISHRAVLFDGEVSERGGRCSECEQWGAGFLVA